MLVRSTIRALDKEHKSDYRRSAALAQERGVDFQDILEIRLGEEIEEVHGTPEQVEAGTIKHTNGETIETGAG